MWDGCLIHRLALQSSLQSWWPCCVAVQVQCVCGRSLFLRPGLLKNPATGQGSRCEVTWRCSFAGTSENKALTLSLFCCRDAKIPEPPAGHQWKEVRSDNTVMWLATWTESVQNSVKYITLNPSSKLKVRLVPSRKPTPKSKQGAWWCCSREAGVGEAP